MGSKENPVKARPMTSEDWRRLTSGGVLMIFGSKRPPQSAPKAEAPAAPPEPPTEPPAEA